MSKKEIVDRIWQANQDSEGLNKSSLKQVVDAVFDEVQNITDEAGKCRIVGFGSFTKYRRDARVASHPQTREKIDVPACNSVKFALGSEFKDFVQDKG
ncbi:MAG: HU family DNA-binding protein [Pseudomonadota bacterium]|nr:HU family DNA-binding protein [Pseudomonadota bacterium]